MTNLCTFGHLAHETLYRVFREDKHFGRSGSSPPGQNSRFYLQPKNVLKIMRLMKIKC